MADRKFRTIPKADFVVLGGDRDDGSPPITMVEGTLIAKDQVNVRGTLVGRYSLQPDGNDAKAFTTLGAKLLDESMQAVEIGTYVRITLEKETTKTAGGNQMKNFKVEVAE